MKKYKQIIYVAIWIMANQLFKPVFSQEKDLAMKLANPVADLISIPFQYNYDENFGPHEKGKKSLLNIQPVWPFSISERWNLITRTIIPLIDQEDIPLEGLEDNGLGDILQSFFFSPKDPINGWILAIGPVFLYPSASNEMLGGEKWAAGPTVLALKQENGWTYGLLANHINSFSGEDDQPDINATFLQPFLSYVTRTKTTLGINTESTYDWEEETWAIPINMTINQLFDKGRVPIQIGGGIRYWADSPENGPEDFGFRFQITLLFPK